MRIPTTYEALEALWDEKGIEVQRLLVEAVLEPITVKPEELRGRSHPLLSSSPGPRRMAVAVSGILAAAATLAVSAGPASADFPLAAKYPTTAVCDFSIGKCTVHDSDSRSSDTTAPWTARRTTGA